MEYLLYCINNLRNILLQPDAKNLYEKKSNEAADISKSNSNNILISDFFIKEEDN